MQINFNTANTLFPVQEFNTAEMQEIAESLTKPAVKKYFFHLAAAAAKGLLMEIRPKNEDAESYLNRQSVVAGGLGVLEELLKIEKPPTAV